MFLLILKLTLHEAAQTRLRHTTTALSLEPGRTRVIMFGGCPKWEWKTPDPDQQKLAKTAVLDFGEQICTWLSFFSSELHLCLHINFEVCFVLIRCIVIS